jgi:integrase
MLDRQEISRLLDTCRRSRNKRLHPYVLVMLSTAMRPSEAAGLTWGQLDLDGRIADLTKTKTEPRRVPLTVPAIESLAAIMPETCDPAVPVFLPPRASLRLQRRPSLYFRKSYATAVTAAGIEDFTLHDLRHTAASWLLMQGTDLRTLAEILGHKTMQMVGRYTHFLDEHKLRAIDTLEQIAR